jgi:hypothetical protein
MSTIKANNISPIGSTLTLGGALAGLTVAGGLSLGGVGYFSGGVTFAGTTNHTGTARFAGNIIGAGNLTLSSSPFAWDGFWPQCVMTHVDKSYEYQPNYQLPYSTLTAETSGGKLTALDTTIIPRRTTSKILYTANISLEGGTQNYTFRLYRKIGSTVTELGAVDITQVTTGQPTQSKTYGGNITQYYGIKTLPYDANNASTPSILMINYLDSPNTTSSVMYFIVAYSANNNLPLYLNKTYSDSNDSLGNNAAHWEHERVTSQVILQEYFA